MHINLDFNASTPAAPEVTAAMRAVLDGPFGNPSSDHWAQVARPLGRKACEIVFTSGGSEQSRIKGNLLRQAKGIAASAFDAILNALCICLSGQHVLLAAHKGESE